MQRFLKDWKKVMGSSLGTVDIHRQIVQETELSCLACKQLSSTWMICKVKQQL